MDLRIRHHMLMIKRSIFRKLSLIVRVCIVKHSSPGTRILIWGQFGSYNTPWKWNGTYGFINSSVMRLREECFEQEARQDFWMGVLCFQRVSQPP